MKNILALLLCFTLLSCSKKSEQKISDNAEKVYVISKEDQNFKNKIDSINSVKQNGIIALPQKGFYGENHLIIDKNNFVYYYQRKNIPIFCSYGIEKDTLPHLLDLQPKDLIKIPKDCIEKIIEENVMTKEKGKQILIVASQKDSIKDREFLKFLHHMKVPSYIIRRTTQEEDTVLHYKKTNQYYKSNDINWDKKRIKF